MNIQSHKTPERILMGPGPSNAHPQVLKAMSKQAVGHLDPSFLELMNEVRELLRYTFQTKNDKTFAVSGPGTLGMESCLVNLVEPGEKIIICQNGFFAGRMKAIVEQAGGIPVMVYDDWGKPISPEKLEDALKKIPDVKVAAFVHAETSTGVLSDAKTLSEIAHKYDCVVLADTVTSLGGSPLYVDDWNIDASYSGSQKCLSAAAGLSPVTFGERAVEKIKNRKTKVQSWFMDLNTIWTYWQSETKRAYHHTAPINSFYGLHEALVLKKEEGLENSWNRHTNNSKKLCESLETIGLKPFVNEEYRLPQLVSVGVPEGINEADVRKFALEKYNLEIGAGLGDLAGKIWRVGLMGYSSNQKNIDLCIKVFGEAINAQNK